MEIALTSREADVMQVLWHQGHCLVAEVRRYLSDNAAYTTVLTTLRTLEVKGHVDQVEEVHRHSYRAPVHFQAARKRPLEQLTDKLLKVLLKGSTELLFTHPVSDQKLTPTQQARLREMPAKARKDDDPEKPRCCPWLRWRNTGHFWSRGYPS